ncbi:DNA-directed RNA polymerase [Cutibacterium acnes JCM 18916]|nr:DNA-directed RNA polymerase [Cutibacterium acnes JCM 18916]
MRCTWLDRSLRLGYHPAEGDWAERLREVGLIDIPEESRLATPVFDGATEQEITGLLQYGHPTRDGEMLVDTDGKATLFDGRTGEPFPSKVASATCTC